MNTAFANEAVRIHAATKMTDTQIGQAVGAAASTVRDWLNHRTNPTRERAQRIAELAEIVDRLGRVIPADYIAVWLYKPIEALDDESPIDLIARGEARRVAQVVSGLESPGAS
ncbi:MAG: hypothetical protein ACJ77M_12285 [Thermoleophilaceae bacterium]